MTILEQLRQNISDKVVNPIKDDFEDTDWGDIDTIVKVDPASIALVAITTVVVAMIIIYFKKTVNNG